MNPFQPVHDNWMYGSNLGQSSELNSVYQSLIDEQRAYNELQMQREDTAYQRMVEDMKKAGLNPWMGVSSGGASSGALTAPKKSSLETLLNALNVKSNISHRENNDLLEAVKTGGYLAALALTMFL